ncbi:hypothetical protein IFM89_022084 [Coptis chinensis]|uniref:Beta-amylase n=1 Tax=Coptis chinensis TaxID=261450 RepID=A0A835IEV9_9MAGN|nr:hypothetical protein IFM89_022084 [Coptis chinensis]
MLGKRNAILNFTCMEMRDGEQPTSVNCSPQGLVKQVKMATKLTRIELAGENALERYDESAYAQVLEMSRSDFGNGLTAFTYLILNKRMFEGDNWHNLVVFVNNMSEGGRMIRLSEYDSTGSNLYVGFIHDRKMDIKKAVLV